MTSRHGNRFQLGIQGGVAAVSARAFTLMLCAVVAVVAVLCVSITAFGVDGDASAVSATANVKVGDYEGTVTFSFDNTASGTYNDHDVYASAPTVTITVSGLEINTTSSTVTDACGTISGGVSWTSSTDGDGATTYTTSVTVGESVENSLCVTLYVDATEGDTTTTKQLALVYFGDAFNGTGSYYVTATNSSSFTVDATAPTVSIDVSGVESSSSTDVAKSYVYTATATVTVKDATLDLTNSSVTVNGTAVSLTADEDGTYTCTQTFTYSSASDATNSYTVAVSAYDAAKAAYSSDDSPSATTASTTFTLVADTGGAPTVSITDGSGSAISEGTVYSAIQTLTITVSNDATLDAATGITVTLSTDGGSAEEQSVSFSLNSDDTAYVGTLDAGASDEEHSYVVSVTAVGFADDGNGSDTGSASASFAVDMAAPTQDSSTSVVSGTGQADADGVYYYQGSASITLNLSDSNLDADSLSATLTASGAESGTDISSSFTAENSTVTGTYTASTSGDAALAEGLYTLSISVKDTAGNEYTYSQSFYLDAEAPVVSASVAGTGEGNSVDNVYQDSATVSVSVSDTYLESYSATLYTLGSDGSYTASGITDSLTLTSSSATGVEATYTVSSEGTYYVVVSAADAAGRSTSFTSATFTVDGADPTVNLALSSESSSTELDGVTYYQGSVIVEISASDETALASYSATLYTLGSDGSYTASGITDSLTLTSSSATGVEATYTVSSEGTYYVVVSAADSSNRSVSTTSATFAVDTAAPTVDVSIASSYGYDTHDGLTYYQYSATVSVSVSDTYLASYSATLYTLGSDGAYTASDVTGSLVLGGDSTDTDVAATYTVDAAGTYYVEVSAADAAGRSITSETASFVVDTDTPTISVSFDNNDGNTVDGVAYYKATRTATITIGEHNFDSSLVSITTNGTVGSWSSSGDTHTITVSFTADGTYNLSVSGADLAGKALETYTADEFVIDTTAPTITLTLDQVVQDTLDDVNYFSGAVELTVTLSDNFGVNYDSASTAYAASGEGASSTATTQIDASTFTVSYGENTSTDSANDLWVQVEDYAGNITLYYYGDTDTTGCSTVDGAGTTLSDGSFLVDATAPKVSGAYSTGAASQAYANSYGSGSSAYVFYNSATSMSVVVTDDLGLESVSVAGSYAVSNNVSRGDVSTTITISLVNGTEFDRTVVLTAVDVTGNSITWSIAPEGTVTTADGSSSLANTLLYTTEASLYPQAAVLDTVAPVLSFSGVTAGTYYNSAQSLTLAVTELNFAYLKTYDANQTVLTITKVAGDASGTTSKSTVSVSSFTGSGDSYSYTQNFSSDGHYTVVAQVTDPATNTTTITQSEFTIDTTAPTISVSFDNNDVENEKYYKATRTATITIVEHNFDSSLVSITTNGTVGSWSSSGDTHTITVSFTADGTYNLSVSGADLAGNALETYTADEFVIDLTAPTITFENVADQTAYNGEVAPVIVYADETSFDASSVTYTLVGSKNGQVDYTVSTAVTETGETVSYINFDETDPDVDDIYTLTATMTDLAGNVYESSITFSVNRYGSTYRVVDAEQYEENNGYLTEAPVVVVEEINVSGVAAEDNQVAVTTGTTTTYLELLDDEDYDEDGEDYSRAYSSSTSSSSYGWSVYTYSIAAGNFSVDGRYYVTVSSDDTSGNKNTSSAYFDRDTLDTANAVVTFILDETDPVVQIVNVEDDEMYDASTYEVTFTVVEAVGLADIDDGGIVVTLDGEEVEVTADEESYGTYTFTVSKASFTEREIKIVATDLAGRTGEASVSGFHVTTNILELHLPLVIAACVAVLAIFFIIFYVRRKKDEDEESAKRAA